MKRTALFIFLLISENAISQIDTINRLYEEMEFELSKIVELQAEDSETEFDYPEEWEERDLYNHEKININTLSPEVAFNILKLSDYQYYQLQSYLENFGEMVSLQELFAIEGFTREDVLRIWPFVEIRIRKQRKSLFKNFFSRSKNSVLLRWGRVLEKQAGYEPGKKNGYLGSPQKLAFRYIFNSQKNFQFGLVGEKDPGEQFFKGTQKQGFDFYSLHLNIKNLGIVRSVMLGDYKLGFGQGLVLWNGSVVMGASVGGIRKFPMGIRPATGFNEVNFFRGVAVEIGNHHYTGTLFYSYHLFDGKLEQDNSGNDVFTSSLSNTGYHRTEAEVAKRNVLKSRLYGFNFRMNRRIFKLGMTLVKTDFSVPVGEASGLYKKYDFSGTGNLNAGIDYHVIAKKSVYFGELAISKSSGIAFLQGAIIELDPRMKIGVLGRYYSKSYIALNGHAFGQNSSNKNEAGIYLSGNIVPGRNVEIFFRIDACVFPWLRYRVDMPSVGVDLLNRIDIAINRNTKLLFQYQWSKKEQNMGTRFYTAEVNVLNRNMLRIQLENAPFAFLKLKTQCNWVHTVAKASGYKKHGILLFQDIAYSLPEHALDFKLRIAFFDTDSYEERIYAYENDLLFSFTVNGYYYRGWRGYFMIKYKYRFMDFGIRIAQTFYVNKKEIGSGLDLIRGDHKTELKMQLYFNL